MPNDEVHINANGDAFLGDPIKGTALKVGQLTTFKPTFIREKRRQVGFMDAMDAANPWMATDGPHFEVYEEAYHNKALGAAVNPCPGGEPKRAEFEGVEEFITTARKRHDQNR